MKLLRVTYFALVALISAASCTKEAAEPNVVNWDDGKIYFKTSLAEVATSRAQDMTLDGLESFQVTCFNAGDTVIGEGGYATPHFENATFVRTESPLGVTYLSSPYEEPHDWPSSAGLIHFFAFSPAINEMAAANPAIEGADKSKYFDLINHSSRLASRLVIDYKLGKVRVNPDISKQFDLVTAVASGERWKDFSTGVELSFRHQMCQVELRAWGAGSGYDFEIAGVRIGNPVVEDNFIFSSDSNPSSLLLWEKGENMIKDKVEYFYQSSKAFDIGENNQIFDTLYTINKENHNTFETAESIMGRGGCAMIIPTVNPKWEGNKDPNIGVSPYTTDKMYFSILMRVTSSNSSKQLYPYPGNPDGLTVVHYCVDEKGAIIARVYPGDTPSTYFTDKALQHPFTAEDGVEVKEFGWAAVPVEADWSPGKRYIYTLDYSEGIGVHDPEDPKPGTPIKGQPTISWGINVTEWNYAPKNEDYQPDVVVP